MNEVSDLTLLPLSLKGRGDRVLGKGLEKHGAGWEGGRFNPCLSSFQRGLKERSQAGSRVEKTCR